MAQPSVDVVSVQPVESPAFVYAPLAAKMVDGVLKGQLVMYFELKNKESQNVTFTHVLISFSGQPNVPIEFIPVPAAFGPLVPQQLRYWYPPAIEYIFPPDPAPGAVKFRLFFNDSTGKPYSDPVTIDMPLAPYQGATYPFPAKASDLKQGEFWKGASGVHGPAGWGTQIFAYDLTVVSWNETVSAWRTAKEGLDANKNDSYGAWDKPVYAMAAGTVVAFTSTLADNTSTPNFPMQIPTPYEGNHFYIQHGPDLALYAHLKLGTMNPALLQQGAQVAAGDLLGRTGNTGRSSEPHLHLQIIRAAMPWAGQGRPVMFQGMSVLELQQVDPYVWPPNSNSPWNKVEGRALPKEVSAIWPGPVKWVLNKSKAAYTLAWAWLIVIGGLMFTPGGIDCIKCGPLWESILGAVSIGIGIAGLARELFGRTTPRFWDVSPKIGVNLDLHEE